MKRQQNAELRDESAERFPTCELESPDDITREIAGRYLHREFGSEITPEQSALLRETPDRIEGREDFERSARAAGIDDTEGLLGFATRPEDPAHVLRGEEVPSRIATEVHEDLHRLTHPELLREAYEDPGLKEFYEGVTQYLTEQAVDGLHEYRNGEIYPIQTERARELAAEVGEQALRDWYFRDKVTRELQEALDRMEV